MASNFIELPVASGGTGDVTLTAFGSTPNANGASLSAQALTLQPASASFPGGVSTTTQVFAGSKQFNGTIYSNAGFSSLQLGTATNVANYASNAFSLHGSYWDGAAAQDDNWNMQIVLGAGTNPYSILNFTHAGSPGLQTAFFPAIDNTPIGLINPVAAGFSTVNVSGLLTIVPRTLGSTPTPTAAGNLALTSTWVLAVWTGSAWVKPSDGTTVVTF